MKMLGITLIVVGCLLGLFAYQMNTTVTTEGKYYGYGINVPSMEVSNIGLMEERRNFLMLSGVLVIVGSIFTVFGMMQESNGLTNATGVNHKKCPFCAESIMSEAIVCRFCGKDVPASQGPEIVEESSEKRDSDNETARYQKMSKYGITNIDNMYHYGEHKFLALSDAIRHAELNS